ncbi:3-ketodihydrosphingosine reductase-like [Gigantopelta aegis]|uniref:3-ketodihydrosphingosine reductase-like n=1 Tax=Gigantopelta aegis TaxID=1735272 RepID=UPI001B88A5B3|nr:3-ketodihydrosphingosine reductase-like [Gigantopelta aegis]
MWLLIAVSVFVGFLIVLYLASPLITPKPLDLKGVHVLVTGGSSGIGKAIAVEVAQRGANICLLARNKAKLEEAQSEIEKVLVDKNQQKVIHISVDISKDYAAVVQAIQQAEEELGPVVLLVNCAGASVAGSFEDLSLNDFKRMIDINYIGTVHVTRAVIPSMKKNQHGRIVFISSQAGQIGLYGYTAYSGSKFALRGLAEALHMELKPYNVYVTLAFPPDTDTPGFAEEQKSKPEETRLISETAGLFQPSVVASSIIKDVVSGRFFSYAGLDGYMLAAVTCGMSPVTSIMEATQQVACMGIFRIISLFYLDHFDRICRKCKQERSDPSSEKKTS